MPNTRTAPPMLPVNEPPAAPGDVTYDAVPVPASKKHRGWLVGSGAVVLAAIVILVVVLTTKSPPQPGAGLPAFRSYQEQLGFSIQVPADWTRTESAQGAQSDVLWNGPQRDPRIGAPQVQVRRDTTGVTAPAYLADKDRSESTDRENADYRKISLTGDELEYVHAAAAGDFRFHVLTRAMVDRQGRLFALTFSLYASDQATLEAEWKAAQPVRAAIRDSFKLTA